MHNLTVQVKEINSYLPLLPLYDGDSQKFMDEELCEIYEYITPMQWRQQLLYNGVDDVEVGRQEFKKKLLEYIRCGKLATATF